MFEDTWLLHPSEYGSTRVVDLLGQCRVKHMKYAFSFFMAAVTGFLTLARETCFLSVSG